MAPLRPGVLIGVRVTDAAQDVAETLRALHGATPQAFEVVLLADPAPGEGERLAAALAPLAGVRRLAVAAPGGGAASFNRLAAEPAELYVLLEAGARPGPGWLERLAEALAADPRHGLAGPSADRCWNEQGVAPGCGPSAREVARQARRLRAQHGAGWRSMAPLYSLTDACLAVRPAVVAAVGAADIAYGRGPCWEMDYAARAARAGFESVWAQSAFVRRGPAQAEDAALLAAGKRLYQDRFCGRRARVPDAPYHAHCLGEACADFAPAAATRIHRPLPAAPKAEAQRAPAAPPLISCVMPTRGRPRFVAQAIAYFRRQDYPNRELIIVHEDEADLPPGLADPSVRTLRTPQRSVGGKREEGARIARGEIIAHWDDDDWQSPQRLSRQARPILQGCADITGLNDLLFLSLASGEVWAATPELFARLFLEDVAGGTLMFRREAWRRSGPYPATSLREEADFMLKAMRDGARLCPMPGRELYVYVRHGQNTWKFAEGQYLAQADWSRTPEPAFLAADRAFYFDAAATPAPPTPRAANSPVLVSCIMPTANRRAFVPRAIGQFLAQDYAPRELIVVDDGEDAIADLIPHHPAIRYLRLDRRATIGAKRNIACELANGELIAHWDDDDWMAPPWLGSQVATLLGADADVCGLDRVYFYNPETRQGWRYTYDGAEPWVCGGTLCYAKAYWREAPFPRIDVGEDNAFLWNGRPKRIALNRRDELYVATIHRGNSSPKLTGGQRWRALPGPRLEALMRGEAGGVGAAAGPLGASA